MSYVKEVAIIAIAGISTFAIYRGINGTFLALCISAIAGLAGYEIGKKRGS